MNKHTYLKAHVWIELLGSFEKTEGSMVEVGVITAPQKATFDIPLHTASGKRESSYLIIPLIRAYFHQTPAIWTP